MNRYSRDPARASLRAEPDSQDGIDPRHLKRRESSRRRKPNHHSLQYGKAAGRAVEAALFSLTDDPAIQSLQVLDAALEGAVLEVRLLAPALTWPELVALEAQAQALGPQLRAAIAAALQRKRTPHVRLRLVPTPVAD